MLCFGLSNLAVLQLSFPFYFSCTWIMPFSWEWKSKSFTKCKIFVARTIVFLVMQHLGHAWAFSPRNLLFRAPYALSSVIPLYIYTQLKGKEIWLKSHASLNELCIDVLCANEKKKLQASPGLASYMHVISVSELSKEHKNKETC